MPATKNLISEQDAKPVVRELAKALRETHPMALYQIKRIVQRGGVDVARELLAKTFEIEASGGKMILNGARRRTPGGVYFLLAAERNLLARSAAPRRLGTTTAPRPAPPPSLWPWEERIGVVRETEGQLGEATNVKITVVGRPGKVVHRAPVHVLTMKSQKVPSLPKGLPAPPAESRYTVYVADKQWKRVEASLVNTEDLLIVEGFPTFDTETNSIAVFATNATTKLLQQAQKQAQQENAAAAPTERVQPRVEGPP